MHGGFGRMPDKPLSLDYLRRLEREMTERALTSLIRETVPVVPASFQLGRAWFVAAVEGGSEEDVSSEARKLGFPTFCPMERKPKVIRGRRTERSNPVFGGYVFVSFDREREDWGQINAIDGALGIIANGSTPSRVPDLVIERLQNADAAGVFDTANTLKDGEAVEVMEGPFSGLIARVKSATSKKRIKILLDALGSVEIDPCFLRKVE